MHRLVDAPIEPIGRFEDASNATLLVRLLDVDSPTGGELEAALGRPLALDDLDPAELAVYKPARGESPLWDFPHGTLHLREVAAYVVADALGWGLVPVTVLREDGPAGPGSLQRFVPHDPGLHYFTLVEHADEHVQAQLRRLVAFDLVIDNADRKAGHVLLENARTTPDGLSGTVAAVDHGVSFHVERKLRTVMWDFVDEIVPQGVRDDLAHLSSSFDERLGATLPSLLSMEEITVLRQRIERVASLERFPPPQGPRPYPWPLL